MQNYLSALNGAPQSAPINTTTAPAAQPQPAPVIEQSDDEEKNKKLLFALGGLAALGAAAIGIGLHIKKGKVPEANTQQAQRAAETVKEEVAEGIAKLEAGVKKFFSDSGKEIDNVKLEKGKAIASDGSPFSGVMHTANKKGRDIKITYKDGEMTSSVIDGKISKTYNNLKAPKGEILPREYGVEIIKEGKNIKNSTILNFDEKGKVRRIFNGETGIAKEFEDGKLSTLSKYNQNNGYLEKAELFNEEGRVIKRLTTGRPGEIDCVVDSFDADGTITKRLNAIIENINNKNIPIDDMGVDIYRVRNYAGKDKIANTIELQNGTQQINGMLDVFGDNSDAHAYVHFQIPAGVETAQKAKFDVCANGIDALAYAGPDGLLNSHKCTPEEISAIKEAVEDSLEYFANEGMRVPKERIMEWLSKLDK